jgi:hypothetical protein
MPIVGSHGTANRNTVTIDPDDGFFSWNDGYNNLCYIKRFDHPDDKKATVKS